jgi:AcrR family transcriptional regulator
MPKTARTPKLPDFRVRVAQAKRERMRQRLLLAAQEVYLPGERRELAVIEDVVRKAGVARGTFYKYFDSLEEVLEALGREMAVEMLDTVARIFGDVDDAAVRVAAGPLITLARAAMEPRWGAFVSRIDYVDEVSQRNLLDSVVTASLVRAQKAGALKFSSIAAATDMIVGATIEATRRLVHGQQQNQAYIKELTTLCLVGLGMTPSAAARAVRKAWDHINDNAAQLSWWHSLAQEA